MKLQTAMPEFKGATGWLNRKVRHEDLKNMTLVHFWSNSCSLCKELLPKLYDVVKDYPVDLVAVHMPREDADENISAIKETVRTFKMTEPIFLDHRHKLTNIYEPKFVPAYYLFDNEQRLRHIQIAGSTRLLENKIQYLLRTTN